MNEKARFTNASLNSFAMAPAVVRFAGQSFIHPEFAWEGQCIEAPAAVVHNGQLFSAFFGKSGLHEIKWLVCR